MRNFWAVGFGAVLLSAKAPVFAATITADPLDNRTGVTSIPTGNIGGSGYILFSTNGGNSASTNVTSGAAASGGYAATISTTGDQFFSDNGTSTPYTNLNAGGAPYRTGVIYQSPATPGT